MAPTACPPRGVCCWRSLEGIPLGLVPPSATDPRGGEQQHPTSLRRGGEPWKGFLYAPSRSPASQLAFPSTALSFQTAVGDALLPDACSPRLLKQDLSFILEIEAIKEHANSSGPSQHRICPGGFRCLPPGMGASPLASAWLCFPPSHVLLCLHEHPHHRAAKALAVNPA